MKHKQTTTGRASSSKGAVERDCSGVEQHAGCLGARGHWREEGRADDGVRRTQEWVIGDGTKKQINALW